MYSMYPLSSEHRSISKASWIVFATATEQKRLTYRYRINVVEEGQRSLAILSFMQKSVSHYSIVVAEGILLGYGGQETRVSD